jgi:hypothetical protein
VGVSAPSYEEKDGKIISCTITVKRKVGEYIGDYSATVYFDEYDSMGMDRYKAFGQQWLTSKIWTTSKLINKYYVLI